MEIKEIIQEAAQILLEPVLRLIENDPHQWSKRPCSTCQVITSIIGRPFGCVKYRKDFMKGRQND